MLEGDAESAIALVGQVAAIDPDWDAQTRTRWIGEIAALAGHRPALAPLLTILARAAHRALSAKRPRRSRRDTLAHHHEPAQP